MINLASRFQAVVSNFSKDARQIAACWHELETAYNAPGRHYHTLRHIEQMHAALDEVKEACADLEAIQLAIFYHDIVYDAQRKDNEAQSAMVAHKRVTALGFKDADKVAALILATQKHERSDDKDTNYLLDIDLNILGAAWPQYQEYAQQVREEYRMYPDAVYKPGRVQVLRHFLNAAYIFKTDYFYHKLEAQARINLQNEIARLS